MDNQPDKKSTVYSIHFHYLLCIVMAAELTPFWVNWPFKLGSDQSVIFGADVDTDIMEQENSD